MSEIFHKLIFEYYIFSIFLSWFLLFFRDPRIYVIMT